MIWFRFRYSVSFVRVSERVMDGSLSCLVAPTRFSQQLLWLSTPHSTSTSIAWVDIREGDGLLSELPCGPNKVLTPVTLAFSPSFYLTRLPGLVWSQTCRDSKYWFRFRCSVSLLRVSEGDGWLSELHCGPKNKVLTAVTLAFITSFHLTRLTCSVLVLNV